MIRFFRYETGILPAPLEKFGATFPQPRKVTRFPYYNPKSYFA
jgi:hypothetical protein